MNLKKLTKKFSKKKDEATSLSSHLKELRKRIVAIAIVFIILVIPAFEVAPYIVEYFVDIAVKYGYNLIYLAPAELFTQYIKVTLVISFSALLPFIFYQIWSFCRPGLKKKENGYFISAVVFGFISFIVGVVFAYFTILPFMLQFFFSVNISSTITANISVSNYISFILSTLLTFGLIFEMPVIITILTALGILKSSFLEKGKKVIIVLIFFICAIITPPDIVSQIMVALPMILLYQFSIAISRLIEKKKMKQE